MSYAVERTRWEHRRRPSHKTSSQVAIVTGSLVAQLACRCYCFPPSDFVRSKMMDSLSLSVRHTYPVQHKSAGAGSQLASAEQCYYKAWTELAVRRFPFSLSLSLIRALFDVTLIKRQKKENKGMHGRDMPAMLLLRSCYLLLAIRVYMFRLLFYCWWARMLSKLCCVSASCVKLAKRRLSLYIVCGMRCDDTVSSSVFFFSSTARPRIVNHKKNKKEKKYNIKFWAFV